TEEIVSRQNRLRPLQMRVTWQNEIAIALGSCDENALQVAEPAIDFVERLADPEFDIRNDLIVAASTGVKLPADVAKSLDERVLNVSMDVFELRGKGKPALFNIDGDLVESRDDSGGLVGRE